MEAIPMKKLIILGLASLLLLPLLALGCQTTDTNLPTTSAAAETKTIDITLDEFQAQANIVKAVELKYPASLTLKVGSNPTTGYQWGEAVISNSAVIAQTSYEYVGPTATGIVGAGGNDVLEFEAFKTGTAAITMGYARSFEEGVPAIYTLTINVTVK
jgi:predicted secreted protein